MRDIKTYYPYTQQLLETYIGDTDQVLENKLNISQNTFATWKKTSIEHRVSLFQFLIEYLRNENEASALLMTMEMGKPISQSESELKKCISLIEFYITNAEKFLADELVKTEAKESFISYDPLGIILGIMPWNFPFWQVLRFAVPTLLAGNTVLLKHADNVTGCAILIEKLFLKAGFPKGTFSTLLIDHDQLSQIIKDDRIKAISLTGSEKAGRIVAEQAGKQLKKVVLELGGSNACIVLNDTDLDKHLKTMVQSRLQNFGQSCIAAKRFFVEEGIYNEFLIRFKAEINAYTIGDPTDPTTELSCMAREDLAIKVVQQIEDSIKLGAIDETGHHRIGTFVQPCVLTNVRPGMPVFDEEVFGPVAAIIKVKSIDEAIVLANQTKFGLGCMLFTEDIEKARYLIDDIEDGSVSINTMTKSNPSLPFGGTKASGYGRELSKEGIREFVNIKTVNIHK